MCVPPRAEISPLAFGENLHEVLAIPVSTGEPSDTVVRPSVFISRVSPGLTDTVLLQVEPYWEEEPMILMTYRHVGKDEMWVTDNPGSQEILYGRPLLFLMQLL